MSLPIRIAAAIVRDGDGRVLLVRKRGTTAFMQPGGKIGPDEDALTALAREVREELGCSIRMATARCLGQFSAPAANEAGATVIADLYEIELDGEAEAAAEIAELAWVLPGAADAYRLAPLTRECVLPLLEGSKQGGSS